MRFSIDKSFMPLILFLVLVIVLGWMLARDPEHRPLALKAMPTFSLPDLYTGDTVTQADLKHQWTVVNIWASWCSPCKQEHKTLLNIAKNTNIPVVGINFKDDAAAAKKWLKERGNPYRYTLADISGRAVFDWGAVGVPETFLVDEQGMIRQRFAGILTQEIWDRDFATIIEAKP